MSTLNTDAFDSSQGFDSVEQAIKLIHQQADHVSALKAIVCSNIDMDELGFASDLLKNYYPADATRDKRFKDQTSNLKMITSCLNR